VLYFKSISKKTRKLLAKTYSYHNIFGIFIGWTGVSYLINWMLQYKSVDGNINLSYRISSQSQADVPWLPQGKISQSIFGVHHFGDWQLMSVYSQISNPYTQDLPAITPPIGLISTRVINLFGIQIGFLIFTIITLTLYWILVTSQLPKLNKYEKIFVFCSITIFSLPFMIAFDRGSTVPTALALVALAIDFSSKNRKIISKMFFCIAISIKPYLIFFLLILLANKKYREVAINIGILIVSNIFVLLTFYSSTSISGLKNYIQSAVFYSNLIEPLNQLKSVSPLSFGSKIIELMQGREAALFFYDKLMPFYFIGTILVLVLGWQIAKNKKLSFEIKIVIFLALVPCLIPNSMFYTLTWSSCAFVYWIKILITDSKEFHIGKFQNLSLLILFMVVLSPNLAVVALNNPSGLYFLQHFLYFPSLLLVLLSFTNFPVFQPKQNKKKI
jgi:hypothetical protein